MVALTRYDCMLGSCSLMLQAVKETIWHTSGRSVFGKKSASTATDAQCARPDLAIEAEAALAISMRIAHALDNQDDSNEVALIRSATAIGKYWICKRAVQHTYEAMECIGGVGYVQDNITSRLYKEAPVNSIWEGSGNVQCLDLLRVFSREPESLEVLINELEKARSLHPDFAIKLDELKEMLTDTANFEMHARRIIERLAQLWQAATLLQFGEPLIADAFVKSRLSVQGLVSMVALVVILIVRRLFRE